MKNGFLPGISRAGGFKPASTFLAATAADSLNGAKPRQFDRIVEDSPDIAINPKTAGVVGLYPCADGLAAADEIYRDIVAPY